MDILSLLKITLKIVSFTVLTSQFLIGCYKALLECASSNYSHACP